MKANAADSIQHPEGGFRIRGEGFISSRDIVGEVDVVYQEADIKLLGPTGLFQRRRAEINRAANERLLEQREGMEPVTRVVGGVTYQDFGPMAESRLQGIFGTVFPVERKALTLDRKEKEDLAGNLRAELKENPEDEATALQLEALDEELAQERVTRRDKRRLEELRAARGQLHEEDVSDLADDDGQMMPSPKVQGTKGEATEAAMGIGTELQEEASLEEGLPPAVKSEQQPYRTRPFPILAALATDAMEKKAREQEELRAAWIDPGEPTPMEAPGREEALAEGRKAEEEYNRRLAEWEAGGEVGDPPERLVSFIPQLPKGEPVSSEEEFVAGVPDAPEAPEESERERALRELKEEGAISEKQYKAALGTLPSETDDPDMEIKKSRAKPVLTKREKKEAERAIEESKEADPSLPEGFAVLSDRQELSDKDIAEIEAITDEPPDESMPSIMGETLGGIPRAAKHPVVEGFQKWAATRPGRKLSERLKARKEKEPESPTSELRPGADVVPTKGYA